MSDASSLQDFSKIFSLPSSESLEQSSYPESLSKKFSSRACLRFGIVTDDKNWISSSPTKVISDAILFVFFFARHPRNIHASFTRAMAQFFLKIAHLSFSMGPAPSLKMVFSYGLRPRLWLLGGGIRTLRLALRETDRAQFLASNQEIFGLSMDILVNLVFVA